MNILNEIVGGISLKIINGQSVTHSKNWHESKTKLYNTIWSIKQGSIHISTFGSEYVAGAGDVILFSPGDIYTAWSDGGCEFVYVLFNLEIGHTGHAHSSASGILSGEKIASISNNFCEEYTASTANANHPGINSYAIFLGFISRMLTEVSGDEFTCFQKRDVRDTSTYVQRAIEYISEHFNECISVKGLAEKFSISEKHFITTFSRITGMSPRQYNIECRMRRAVELLRERDKTIAEIADEVGYSDQYSFSKAFKKQYGVAPSLWRERTGSPL